MNLIGCNIRPGQTRGGMMTGQKPLVKKQDASQIVREAARVFLEKRGFTQQPDHFTAQQDFRRRL